MTTRARKDRIVVALNTVGGRIVDESSLADGAFLRYDALNDRYVHYIIDNYDGFVPYTGAVQDLDLGEYSLNTTSVKFNTSQYTGIPNDGELYWDYLNKCLNLPIEGKELNIGEELWVPLCLNDSGEDLINGEPVYIFNSFNGYPTIRKANNMEYKTSRMIGVVTETIPNGEIGRVTRFGYVRDINLSAFAAGDEIFLGPNGIQSTRPTGGYFPTSIGKCITPGTTGKMLVYPRIAEYTDELYDHYSGWPVTDSSQSTLTLNNATRTLTITPVGTQYYYYSDGQKYLKTSAESFQWANIEGIHIIYYNGNTIEEIVNPTYSQLREVKENHAGITTIYWSVPLAMFIYANNERQSVKMLGGVKSALLDYEGCKILEGLSITNMITDASGNLTTSAQFGSEAGIIRNQSILTSIPSKLSTVGYSIYYRFGISAWRIGYNPGYAVLTTGTGRAAYNQNVGGSWQLTEVPNNGYVIMHFFTSNTLGEKIGAVMGQNFYSTASTARANVGVEFNNLLTIGLPIQEFAPLWSVIYETRDSYSNAVKSRIISYSSTQQYIDWRGTSAVAGGGSSGSTTSFLGLLDTPGSFAGSANTLVQVNSTETGLIFSNILNNPLTVNGTLTINGDIIQSGSTYETHAEQVYSTQDYIILREGAISGLAPSTYSGIRAKLYDGTNDGHLVFDNAGIARVGDVGSEQPLATRIENPTNGQIAYWEGANNRLNFKTLTSSDISNLGNGTLTAVSGTTGATNTTVSLNFSVPYSANTTTNTTINPVIGPALSNLATYMTGTSNIGFIKKTAADTYTVDTNTYATTSQLHSPVTVTDSSSINLTLVGQDIQADAIFGTTAGTIAEGNHAHAAYVNQNAFSNIAVSGQTTVAADSATDTFTLVAGNNVSITTDAVNDSITINAVDTVYTHPTYTARNVDTDGVVVLDTFTSDGTGHVTAITTRTLPNATTSLPGVMSAADKAKLEGLSNYSLVAATSTVLGGTKLFSDTTQTIAANTVSATASRTYGLQNNSSGQLVVNVPWTDSYSSVTKGNLTTNVTGLQFSNSTQVIGGATELQLVSGYEIPTTTSIENWNTAHGWGNHAGLYIQSGRRYIDQRTITPTTFPNQDIQFGFTSTNISGGAYYADFINFGGYQDASAGRKNLLLFTKSGFGIRQYQGDFGGSTYNHGYVDYWHTGNFTPSNYVPYTGATTTVNLGSQALTTTGNIKGNQLSVGVTTIGTSTHGGRLLNIGGDVIINDGSPIAWNWGNVGIVGEAGTLRMGTWLGSDFGGFTMDLSQNISLTGNLTSAGTLQGTRLISTTTSTAPLSVASTTFVPNLNVNYLNSRNSFGFVRYDGIGSAAYDANTIEEGSRVKTEYRWQNTPSPSAIASLHTDTYSSDWIWQEFNQTQSNGIPEKYLRIRYNGTAWGDWYRVWHSGNFNPDNYQTELTNPVTYSASTANYLPKWTGLGTLGNSQIYDNGTNVGIGTITPASKLEVIGNTRINDANGNSVSIGYSPSLSGNYIESIKWGTTHESTDLVYYIGSALGNNNHRFYTNAVERLRIDITGNVGIGTTAPLKPLHVSTYNSSQTAISYPILIENRSGVDNLPIATGLGFKDESVASIDNIKAGIVFQRIAGYGVGTLHFLLNNTLDATPATLADARMSITKEGRVGIGTTTPLSYLHVRGGASAYPTIDSATGSIFNITNADPLYGMMFGVAGDGTGWIQQQRSAGSGQYHLVLNPLGGNVGIGTISPTQKLDVNGNIQGAQLISTIATGTAAPLSVVSTDQVNNLNSEMLGGLNKFQLYGVAPSTGTWVEGTDANAVMPGRYYNYYSVGAITNAPVGMGYGTLYNLGGASHTDNALSLQLAADINHNSTSSTKSLWFRMANNLGFQNDWKEIYHTGNFIAGTHYQAPHSVNNNYLLKSNGLNGIVQSSIYDNGIGLVGVNTYNFALDGGDAARTLNIHYNSTSWPNYSTAITQTGAGLVSGTFGLVINTSTGFVDSKYGISLATDGVSKLFVQHTGNVGIGTINPLRKLDVEGSARVVILEITDNATNVTNINKDGEIYNPGRFVYKGYNGTDVTEWFRIRGDLGYVGIGTTTPTSHLHISKAGTQSITLETPGQPSYTTTITNNHDASNRFQVNVGGVGFFGVKSFGVISADTYIDGYYGTVLATGGTPRLYVAQAGNIGIGTINPQSAYMLDIRDNINAVGGGAFAAYTYSGNSSAAIRGTGYRTSGTNWIMGVYGQAVGNGLTGKNIGGYFTASGGDENYGLIVEEGNVGIGTTDPQSKFQVKSNSDVNFAVSYGVTTPSAVLLNAYNDAVSANIPMEFRASSYNFTVGTVSVGGTQVVTNSGTWGISITGSTGDATVTYAKLATDLTSRQAISASDINWASGGVYTKTLAANTTFTFSNLQLNKIITAVISGNYTIALPAYCKRISGTYDGATSNYIQFHCTNNTSGSEEVWYTISKQA